MPPLCAVRPAGYDAGWEDRSRLAFGQCVRRVSLCEVVIMRNRTGWILSLAGVLIFSGHARLRAQVVDKPQEDSKAIKAMVEDSISWYQVFSDASAPRRWRRSASCAGRTEHAGRKNQTACSSCGSTRGGPRLRQASSRMKARSTTNSCHCRGERSWWRAKRAA